jgi:hypothetical protein
VERLYFACCVRMNGSDAFVIWYQDEHDGFVRSPDGQLLVADSFRSLAAVAAGMGLPLVPDETAEYDFDRLRDWCRRPSAEGVECPAFLNAWNFFDDLAGLHNNPDSPYAKLSRGAGQSYDKLFWGNNLPSVTPPGERFTPSWGADELDSIRRVMEAGLGLVEAELRV